MWDLTIYLYSTHGRQTNLCPQKYKELNMLLQLCLFQYFIFLPLSSGAIAKPGCPERCGNLPIPFPFGVGPDCYMGPSFAIRCNTSTNPPTPFLSIIDSEIVELHPTQIRVKFPNLALTTYGQNGTVYTVTYNLSPTQYTFSYDNWVTAVGCDDTLAVTGQANLSFFAGGCVAYCQNRDDSGGTASCPVDGDGYALGIGCCRTPIPRGNLSMRLSFVSKFIFVINICIEKWNITT